MLMLSSTDCFCYSGDLVCLACRAYASSVSPRVGRIYVMFGAWLEGLISSNSVVSEGASATTIISALSRSLHSRTLCTLCLSALSGL